MAWWNLFRSTVVPTVQQAVASTTQQEGAAAADTPVESTNPGVAANQERRRQGDWEQQFFYGGENPTGSDYTWFNRATGETLGSNVDPYAMTPDELGMNDFGFQFQAGQAAEEGSGGIAQSWWHPDLQFDGLGFNLGMNPHDALNIWNQTSGDLNSRLEQWAQLSGQGAQGLPSLAMIAGLPMDEVLQSGPMTAFFQHLEARQGDGFRRFGNMILPGIIAVMSAGAGSGVAGALGSKVAGGAAAGALGGGLSSAMSGDNILEGAATGGLAGAAGGGLFQSGMLGSGVGAGAAAGALGGGLNAALRGGDLERGMLAGGLTGGLMPLVGSAFDGSLWGDAPAAVPGDVGAYGGMDADALAKADFSGSKMADANFGDESLLAEYGIKPGAVPTFSRMAMTPELPWDASSTQAMTTFSGGDGGMLPMEAPADVSLAATDPSMAALASSSLSSAAMGDTEQPAEQPTEEAAPEKSTMQKVVEGALKQTVNALLGSETPDGAPVRDEGETDEQYTEELLTYLELDPQAMADLGLQPGSPEYMNYILEQADLRIAELTEGMDLNAEDLSEQLRAKTQEELMALQRALYVRGQLETMVGSGTVIDPTTGEDVEVIGEGMFNPGTAGYQAGLARDIEGLTSLDQLQKLLTRGFDPYGMQRSQDARLEQAKRTEREEEELRRRRSRGMLGL